MKVEVTKIEEVPEDEKTKGTVEMLAIAINGEPEMMLSNRGANNVWVSPNGGDKVWGPFESTELGVRRALVNLAKSASTSVKRALNPQEAGEKRTTTRGQKIDTKELMNTLRAEILAELRGELSGEKPAAETPNGKASDTDELRASIAAELAAVDEDDLPLDDPNDDLEGEIEVEGEEEEVEEVEDDEEEEVEAPRPARNRSRSRGR